MAQTIEISWPDMKEMLDGTMASLSFVALEEADTYRVISESWGAVTFQCRIPKSSPPGDEQADFETNWKGRKQPPLVQKTGSGIARVAAEKPDFSKTTIITHDWSKKRTWYSQSVHVARKALTQSGADPTLFQTGDTFLIDTSHGLLFQEDTLLDQEGRTYRVSVWRTQAGATSQLVEVDPHTGAGDFTVDHDAGTITVPSATPGTLIEAEYHKAGSSRLVIAPETGKTLVISEVEINFSKDMILTDTAVFQPMGNVGFYAPMLVGTPSFPTPTTKIALGPPLRYKSMRDYYAESQKAYPTMPSIGGGGWRGMPDEVLVLSWDYVSATKLLSSRGMEIHVSLEHDVPFQASMATVTFYCVSETE